MHGERRTASTGQHSPPSEGLRPNHTLDLADASFPASSLLRARHRLTVTPLPLFFRQPTRRNPTSSTRR